MWGFLAVVATAAAGPNPARVPMEDAVEVDPAGHGCLDRSRLVEQMQVWLERDTLDARIQIHVQAEPTRADRVHFWVERDGERVVDRPFEPVPDSCDAVHAALGLAIAFALDSTVLGELGVRAGDDAPPAPASSTQDAPDTSPPAPPPTPVSLRVEASTGLGLHPVAGFGGQFLTAIVPIPVLAVRIGAGMTAGLATPLGNGEIRTDVIFGRLDLCGGATVGRVDLRGCAGTLAGFMGIHGKGHPRNADGFTPWIAVLGGAALTLPATRRVAFALDLDGVIPVLKPRIVIEDASTGEVSAARRLPTAGGMVSLGLAIKLR